jgi:hypothetical protein
MPVVLSRQIMSGRNVGRIYLLRLFEGSRALDMIAFKLPPRPVNAVAA